MKIEKNKTKKVARPPKKFWKYVLLFVAVLAMSMVAFVAYLYAQVSRITADGLGDSGSLFRNLAGGLSANSALKGMDNDRINIAFAGMGGTNHPGGQLTDSIMVASFKPKEKTMALLSVPRDLYVPIADHNTKAKINEAYYIGEKDSKGGGAALFKKTLSNTLGIPIHYYITADFAGFEKIVDELGGIDVFVDKTIYDPYYPDEAMEGYDPFYIKEGQHHLKGDVALKFARSRETSSDFDRAARQQKILVAVREKMLSLGFLGNPKKILDTAAIIGDHVRTDITPYEMKEFAELMKNLDTSKTINKVLTNGSDGPLTSDSSSGTYYLMPKNGDYSLISDVAENIFETETTAPSSVKIEVINGTSEDGLGGKVSESLKRIGYQVVDVSTSKISYKQSVIYDYGKVKDKNVLAALRQKIGASAVTKQTPPASGADFSIIIGENYLNVPVQTTGAAANN